MSGGHGVIDLQRLDPGSVRSKEYFTGDTAYIQHSYVQNTDLGPMVATLRESEPHLRGECDVRRDS